MQARRAGRAGRRGGGVLRRGALQRLARGRLREARRGQRFQRGQRLRGSESAVVSASGLPGGHTKHGRRPKRKGLAMQWEAILTVHCSWTAQ